MFKNGRTRHSFAMRLAHDRFAPGISLSRPRRGLADMMRKVASPFRELENTGQVA